MTDPTARASDAIASVVRSCRDLGLDRAEPEILRVGANAVIRLQPYPVVARIATLTAEMRGDAAPYLCRERDLTITLDEREIRVITPTDIVDPGPHRADGFAFLLLQHHDLEPVDLTSPEHAMAAGRALAELTSALAELPDRFAQDDQGHPWAEIENLSATIADSIESGIRGRIGHAVESLRLTEPEISWQVVHGDAHRGNVAFEDGRIIWFDFEDANRRPLAWDLATLLRAWPPAGEEACRLIGVDPGDPVMRWHHELREVYALLWSQLYAMRDDRVRSAAVDRLEGWLERTRSIW